MEAQDILRYVVPVVIGVVALYVTQRMIGRVGSKGLTKLKRFGLEPVEGAPSGGSRLEGTYRGVRAGYNLGKAAVVTVRVGTQVGGVQSGSEFWAELGFDGPPLAIVERGDKAWKKHIRDFVPRQIVPTGDAAFDGRFQVRCEDQGWVAKAVTPELRAHLMGLPLVLLIQADKKVLFPMFFDGTKLYEAFGIALKDAWNLFDRADVFLDAALAMVEAMQVARQTGGDPV